MRWFYIWQAILAGGQFATSSALLGGIVGEKVAGAAGLISGSLQVSTATWAALSGSRLALASPSPTVVSHEVTK